AVQLDRRGAQLLDGEPGGEHPEHRVAEVEQDLEVVIDLDGDGHPVDVPGRNRDGAHRRDPAHRTQKPGKGGQVVDTEVEHRAPAIAAIEPWTPVRTGPAVDGPRTQHASD